MGHRPFGLAILGLLMAGSALAADPPKDAKDMPPMDPAMMEAWTKAATPGEQHKHLAYFVGDWTANISMYMEGHETKSTGTVHYDAIMSGRYLVSKHKGDFNGMPFEGMGIDGYDNVNQEYFGMWFDNMGTGYLLSKGKVSADGKTMTYTGSSKDPMTGKAVDHRMVTTIMGPDMSKFEMYMTPAGDKENKMMEIVYTRVKS
jgi:hypothetical protein